MPKILPYITSISLSLFLTVSDARSAELLAGIASPTVKLISPKYGPLIEELTKKGFDPEFLAPLFDAVILRPEIIEKFEKPAEKLTYYEYKKRFLDKSKGDLVAKGLAYLEENRELLERVETEWDLPKEIILAILGVETRFGQPGIEKYQAWDIYNTGYILFTRREAFYKEELISFLILCQEEGLDPLSIKSSYAGAIGIPQFMPSSVLKFAVDSDGDQKRDLWSSKEDIYASVAAYLNRAGWKKGGITHLPAKITGSPTDIQKLVEAGIRETLPVSRAIKMGIELPESVSKEEAVSFAFYKPEEGEERLIALFNNFRVITRYNFSVSYALLITELAELFKNKGIVPTTIEEDELEPTPEATSTPELIPVPVPIPTTSSSASSTLP